MVYTKIFQRSKGKHYNVRKLNNPVHCVHDFDGMFYIVIIMTIITKYELYQKCISAFLVIYNNKSQKLNGLEGVTLGAN